MTVIAARVAGKPVSVADIDAKEAELRAGSLAGSLPLTGTSEGRQLRRWVTQLIVTERLVIAEAARMGISAENAPPLAEVLPNSVARVEIGSVTAAVLADPLARALFGYVTADVEVPEDEVVRYHTCNPMRFAVSGRSPQGWRTPGPRPPLAQVRGAITAHLLAAARRRAFRNWLDTRRAALVRLSPGYEHPGDPRQPDNVHRH
jgi:[acyl-carrier-protein] S-malonyltransferase